MYSNFIKTFVSSLFSFVFILGSFTPVFAQELGGTPSDDLMINQQNEKFAESAGVSEIDSDPRLLIMLVIEVVMGFIGIALIAYAVYGGYIMITASGDADRVAMGKTTIVRSIIGLIIIASAYTISVFIGSEIQKAVFDGEGREARSLFSSPQGRGTVPNDPFFERDDTFCTGITCEDNGVSGSIFPNTPDNGSGGFFEIN